MARIASGIEGLDALVGGGLPEGSSIILQGPSGLEKLQFALTFLAEGLKTGGSGVLVVASQTAESILSELRSRGVDLDAVAKENRLRIVDWYSWSEDRITDVEERGIILRSTIDLSSLGAALSRAIAALPNGPGKRAVVEMFSPALNVYELTQVYAFAQSAKRKFDRFAFTSFFLVEKDMHDESVLSTLAQPFDGVIELERTRAGDRIVRKLGVLHLKDTTPPASFVPLEQTEKGFRVVLPQAPAPVPPFTPAEAAPTPGAKKIITPPLAEPESAEARTTRVQLINQIAEERLRVDPADKDAWFALAAGQAILRDVQGSLKSLEKLAALDPRYPGLWVLKAKLHARLGQEEEWRQARMKADEFEEPSTGPAAGLVPCPVCNQPVAPETSLCPHCGSRTEPEKDIIEELEALTKATIQDLVEESAHQTVAGPEVPPAAKPKAKPAVKPEEEPLIDVDKSLDELAALVAEPAPAPPKASAKARGGEARKGLTNGLVFGRKRERTGTAKGGRTNGLTNGLRGRTNGLTNGLGRTNGLTNGLRGRTNGLTNGLGRTNGLTNGLRGRTNGLTNGLGGRTNGLTNGLRGRTNGLTNGLGRTNGLTNGVGRTNGLTNGLVKVAKQRGFFGRGGRASWQRLGLAATLVVLIILLPVVFLWSGPTVSYPIQVDGQFGDWAGVTKLAVPPPPAAPNPNIEITRVALKDNVDFLAFYVQVQGNATTGGPAPARITDTFFAFIDADRSQSTGYQVQGIGADRMVKVSTWGGRVVSASLMLFDPSRGPRDWNGWTSGESIFAAAVGSQLEFEVPWAEMSISHGPVEVAFAARSWDGQSDAADVVASSTDAYLIVSQDTRAPLIISNATPILSTIILRAVGAPVTVSSLNVTLSGTFGPTSLAAVDLVDASGIVLAERPAGGRIQFSLSSFALAADTSRFVTVQPKVNAPDGTTVGAIVENLQDVVVASGGVAFVGTARTPQTLAYIGAPPTAPAVDGGFADWPNAASDPVGDVQPVWNSDVDLSAYAFQGNGGTTYFMAETVGTAMNGTMIPAFNPSYVPPANGTGNGTTVPPRTPPPENGTDSARFYLDQDGSVSTGYQIGGIGADYLVEVTGKEGVILSGLALQFNGASPFDWKWASLGLALAAKDRSQMEAAIPGVSITNASRAYFEMTGWNGVKDVSSRATPSLVTLGFHVMSAPPAPIAPSVGVNPIGVQPLDIPGNQKWYFTSAVPSPNAATCTSNFAASTTPGTSATSTTLTGTQSICWYTPTGQPASTAASAWDFTLDLTRVDSTQTFVPNAQGTNNQWGVVGCVLASSNACVSSNDANTSYIASTNNQPNVDTFNIPDWASPPSPLNITNVRVSVWCYAASAQPGKVATYIMNGSTNTLAGTTTACSQGPYTEVASNYASYPWGTARPWTAADINALEIGAQDADSQAREIRVTYIQLTVSYTPVYSVSIFFCTQTNCGAGSFLYGPTNVAAYGNNITITTGTIPAQTLAANDRIRFQVALVSGTSVTVNYNGPTVPGTSDSRASVPIPEFQDVAFPIAGVLLITLTATVKRRRRRSRRPECDTA